jgi:hypothetical protein
MKGPIFTVFKRELASYFATPVAYVFIVIFLLLAGTFTFYLGNFYERGQADLQRRQKTDERVIRVRVAKKFTRLAYVVLAGHQILRHDCCQPGDSILLKLSEFHRLHLTSPKQLLIDLQAVVDQLPKKAYTHEAQSLSETLDAATSRRRIPVLLGELLPAVLARLTAKTTGEPSEAQASR